MPAHDGLRLHDHQVLAHSDHQRRRPSQKRRSQSLKWGRGFLRLRTRNCWRRATSSSKLYYRPQRARGNDHHAAVRALAYKWIRIIFRCWKDRTPTMTASM
jgi:hypothetical protein